VAADSEWATPAVATRPLWPACALPAILRGTGGERKGQCVDRLLLSVTVL